MKVLVLLKATVDSEAGRMPPLEVIEAMTTFHEDLHKAGVLLAAEGALPSAHGKRVRISPESRQVIDGPFAETKELVAGFWLFQVRSIEEAVEWVKRFPPPASGECEIEIRPLIDPADFGGDEEAGAVDGLRERWAKL